MRAMVLLIVLMVLAVLSVIVATQLGASGSASVASLRSEEEIRARAISEQCMEMAIAYADSVATANPDYDLLLNPGGGNPDYLPPAAVTGMTGLATPVAIPKNAVDDRQKYRMYLVDGGACAVRYDDNDDDQRGGLLGTTTAGLEGLLGINTPNLDRDGAVFVTSIGFFPVDPACADPCTNAYGRAHARVTQRRFLSASPSTSTQVAIQAGNNVHLKENSAICGEGGLGAGSTSYNAGALSTCICGTQDIGLGAPSVECSGGGSSSTEAPGCPCTSPPSIDAPPPPPLPPPPAPLPAAPGTTIPFMDKSAFAVPSGTNVGNNNACEIYVLMKDSPTAANPRVPSLANVYVWDRSDAGCGSDASATVPLPADADGVAAVAAGESACWTKIAELGNGAGTFAGEQSTGGGAGERLAFNNATTSALPGGVLAPDFWNTCGGGSTCNAATCDGSQGWLTASGGRVATPQTSDVTKMPSPLVVIVDNVANRPVHVEKENWRAVNPPKVTWVVRNDFMVAEDVHLACASCNNSSATYTGGECTFANRSFGDGVLVHAGGFCGFKEKVSGRGDIVCSSVHMKEASDPECYIGDVVAHGGKGGGGANGFYTAAAGYAEFDAISMDTQACNSGGASGMPQCDKIGICIKEFTKIVGSVYSQHDVCMKESIDLFGQVVGREDVNVKELTRIEFDGIGFAGAPSLTQGSGPWMDSMW